MKIMIQFNIVNYNEELKNKILNQLANLVHSKLDPEAQILFYKDEPYWKIPEDTLFFIRINSNNNTKIKDFKNIFDVNFNYSSSENINGQDPERHIVTSESAIWDSYANGGTLLNENIKWAHIYTDHTQYDLPSKDKKADIILQLNISNYNQNIKDELLQKIATLIDNKIKVEFRTSRPDDNEKQKTLCFFNIYSDEKLSIEKLLKQFNTTWEYSSFELDNTNIEEASWSKRSSNEILLNKNVNWAAMYNTWQ